MCGRGWFAEFQLQFLILLSEGGGHVPLPGEIMEAAYHEIIALTVLARLPQLRGFFDAAGHTDMMIREDAVRPDTCYHDSVMQNAELHHAHSIKLFVAPSGQLRWRDGDCIDSIKAYSGMCLRYYASKDFDLVCRSLVELSHYIVDGMTFPHLVRGKPWSDYHMSFEISMAAWLRENEYVIPTLVFTREKSIFRSALARAKALYPQALDVVFALEKGTYGNIGMTDADALTYTCKVAAAVGSAWITIMSSLFPKE